MVKNDRFSRDQKMITVLCMIAYSVLYFMRLNISLALTGMEQTFQVTPEALGVVSTAFFWCYAFGQLIFGFLGDRLSARYMVSVGLIGSAILNFAVSVAPTIGMVTVFWAINGLFQSMLWSPIVKCVAKYFEGNKKVIASFALSITQVVGYILAWVGSYFIERCLDWRYVFRIPAILGFVFGVIFFLLFRYSSISDSDVSEVVRKKGTSLIRQPALVGYLGIVAVSSVLLGLVRSSIDTWLPTLIEDFGGLSEEGIIVTLVFIPLLNFVGIMLAKAMVKHMKGDIYKSILLVWGGSLVISGISLFVFGWNSIAFVIVIAILFGFVYGLTPLFTSFVPLDFEKWNCVSTVTGFVDFAIYFGAGITGTVSGIILGTGPEKNWSALNFYWFATLLVGMIVAIIVFSCHHKLRKKIRREEAEWD